MASVKTKKDTVRDLKFTSLFLLTYGFLFGLVIPALLLFAGGGAEEAFNLEKVQIYWPWLIIPAVALLGVKMYRFVVKGKTSVDIPGADGEDSPFRHRIFTNPYLSWLLAILLFTPVVVLSAFAQNEIFPAAAVPDFGFAQQVSPVSEVGLAVWPASVAETLSLVVLLGILLSLNRWLASKGGVFASLKQVVRFVAIPLIGAGFWMMLHLFRYGATEQAILSVFMFGLISSLLTVVFMNLIFPLVYHDINNLFVKLFELFSNDAIIGVVIVVYIIIFISFALLVRRTGRVKSPFEGGG